MSLRAVIFDLDGVITATVELHYQAWRQALLPYGITWSREQNDALRSLTRAQSLKYILNERSLPEAEQQNILMQKNRYYLESAQNLSPSDLLPGISRLLGEIRQAGLLCGVASASSNTRLVLERLQVLAYMDRVVDANDVPVSKPAPDVYLRVASLMNVSPSECLALDDSPAGVISAARAGMCAVGVGEHAKTAEAQVIYQSLENVHVGTLLKTYEGWKQQLYAQKQPQLGEFPAIFGE